MEIAECVNNEIDPSCSDETVEWNYQNWKNHLRSYVQMVPVAELLKFREYAWSAEEARRDSNKWNQLVESVKRRGVSSPLFLEYDIEGFMILSEGNHRLAVAAELGIEYVPVYVRINKYLHKRCKKDHHLSFPPVRLTNDEIVYQSDEPDWAMHNVLVRPSDVYGFSVKEGFR